MERRLPGDFRQDSYSFTLVATGGSKELFYKAIPSVLKEMSGFDEPPQDGFTVNYRSKSCFSPCFFIAKDEAEPSKLELDIYGEFNRDTASFAQSLGLLTTPLLRAGYNISVADRSSEIRNSRDRIIPLDLLF